MTMKKTTAGVLASIVAVSAMATTIASAKTVAYAAIDKTIKVEDSYWNVKDYEKTLSQNITGTISAGSYGTQTVAGITFTNKSGTACTVKAVAGAINGTATPAAITVSGTDITITGAISASGTATTSADANNALAAITGTASLPTGVTISGTACTNAAVSALPLAAATSTSITAGAAAATIASDSLTLNFTDKIDVEEFKISFINNDNNGKTYTYEDGNSAVSFGTDKKSVTITGLTLPASADYTVKMEYDILPADKDTNFKSEEKAQDANVDNEYAITSTYTGTAATVLARYADKINNFSDKATFDVNDDDSITIDSNGDKNLDDDVVSAIAAAIEGRTKAKIILNYKDPDFDDSDVKVTLKIKGTTFSSIKQEVDYDASADTATFDWATLTKSTSGTTLGDVTHLFNSINVAMDSDDVDDGDDFTLKSVTVKGDAENASVLSAGESVADTTAAITTAATAATAAATVAPAAVTAAATTATASNPKTGNAPIALAVIPVAIAAAAIIAKKRG